MNEESTRPKSFKKITLGGLPVGTKSNDGGWSGKNVRKDPRRLEDGEVIGRDLVETGIDRLNAGLGASLAKKPPRYTCPPNGPDPDYFSPAGRKRLPHQKPGRIVSDVLKPDNKSYDKEV